MKRYLFPSQLNPDKFVFCYTDDWDELWDRYYRSAQPFHLYAWMSDTYGDGQTMHTPLYSVGPEHFTDYCLSLAKYLIDNPTLTITRFCHAPSAERMAFAFRVKYEPEKGGQWFDGEKISSNENKRHDKRWHEVKECHDGTVWGAYNVLMDLCDDSRKRDVITRYTMIHALSSYGRQFVKHYVDAEVACEKVLPAGLQHYSEDPTDHLQAFHAMELAITAAENRVNAQRVFECALGNSQRRQEKPAEKVAA